MSSLAYAEIPFTQIKGLDGICKDADFNPIHGYDLLYSNTIKHIRFYGNYGVLIDPAAYQDSDAYPKFSQEYIQAENEKAKKLRHPYFTIKKGDSAENQSNKNHEYPFDAMSALVQWLFPSPTKTQLIPNTLSSDVIGELSRSKQALVIFLQIVLMYKSTGARTLARELEDAFCDSMVVSITSSSDGHFTKQAENELEKNNKIELYRRAQAKKAGSRSAKEEKALKNYLELKQQYSNKLSQRIKNECQILFSIVYDALRMTGCLHSIPEESKGQEDLMMQLGKVYPPKAALRTIIGFVWMILKFKEELLDVYRQSGLLQKETKVYPNAVYSKDFYIDFKNKIVAGKYDNLSHVERSFAAYGYYVYEASYPPMFGHKPLQHTDGHQYADCNETAYLNWFRCLLWDKVSRMYDVSRLDRVANTPYIESIKQFFTLYSDSLKQDSITAHQAWAQIMNDLQDAKTDNTIQGISYAKADSLGRKYELSFQFGYITLLNVFGKIFNDDVLQNTWPNENLKSEECKAAGSSKLQKLCEIFSKIHGVDIGYTLDDVYKIIFLNNQEEKEIGFFRGSSGHMEFTLIALHESNKDFENPYIRHNNIFFTADCQFQNAYNFESMSYWQKALTEIAATDKTLLKNHILRMIQCYLYFSWYALRIDGNSQKTVIQSIVNGMEEIFLTMRWLRSPLLIHFFKEMDVPLAAFWYFSSDSTNHKIFFSRYYLKKYQLGLCGINSIIDKYSALMIACQNELCDAQDVQYALDLGADVNQIFGNRSPAVMSNLTLNKLDVLLKHGLNVNMYVSERPLIYFWYTKVEGSKSSTDLDRIYNIIKKIIAYGADINLQQDSHSRLTTPGATLLLSAVYRVINLEPDSIFFKWNLEFIDYLIHLPNINFHIQDDGGNTAINLIKNYSISNFNNLKQGPVVQFKPLLAKMQEIERNREKKLSLQPMLDEDIALGYSFINMSKARQCFLATPQNQKQYLELFLSSKYKIDNLQELDNLIQKWARI